MPFGWDGPQHNKTIMNIAYQQLLKEKTDIISALFVANHGLMNYSAIEDCLHTLDECIEKLNKSAETWQLEESRVLTTADNLTIQVFKQTSSRGRIEYSVEIRNTKGGRAGGMCSEKVFRDIQNGQDDAVLTDRVVTTSVQTLRRHNTDVEGVFS